FSLTKRNCFRNSQKNCRAGQGFSRFIKRCEDSSCEIAAKTSREHIHVLSGPTGVVKTESVIALVETLNRITDTDFRLIRVDCNQYMESHRVSNLLGSPPGFRNSGEPTILAPLLTNRCILLFDEIEKAHPDVMNILLQILDEGKVNDAHGRTVSFENTVIAMTSNAGSTDKSTGLGFTKTEGDISTEKAMKALKDFLRPEFLSRVDEVVVFKPLKETDYTKIVKLMVEEMREPLKEKSIDLKVSEDVYAYAGKKAFGGKYGGRDIRRVIRDEIENAVAMLVVEKGEEGIKAVNISVKGDKIYVK
ncbi:MAG: AAA family ATPase, partial [Oscillospiraceae bacterium]|nr:AAA family ATPase [Oscillospiraceae bacterium]